MNTFVMYFIWNFIVTLKLFHMLCRWISSKLLCMWMLKKYRNCIHLCLASVIAITSPFITVLLNKKSKQEMHPILFYRHNLKYTMLAFPFGVQAQLWTTYSRFWYHTWASTVVIIDLSFESCNLMDTY